MEEHLEIRNEKIAATIRSLKAAQLVVLFDDLAANGATYLLSSASSITDKLVNTMIAEARGVILAPMSTSRFSILEIPLMGGRSKRPNLEMGVGIEARQGVTTGISAADRACSLKILANSSNPRRDIVMPGHIFPLRAKDGGVLVRHAPAEAAVDLMKIAALPEVAAICQCFDTKGAALGLDEAIALSEKNSWPLLQISDVVEFRMNSQKIIEEVATAILPTAQAGTFNATAFRSLTDNSEHLAFTKGDVAKLARENKPVLTRVQAERTLEDLLGIQADSSRNHLVGALKEIDREGAGIFVYIRHPRQGLLKNQVDALAASLIGKEHQKDTNPKARPREIGIGAQILNHFGISKIRLLSNSSVTPAGLSSFGLEIVEKVTYEPGHRQCLSKHN